MGFRLVLPPVTLYDLERRNSPYFASFHRNREIMNLRGRFRHCS